MRARLDHRHRGRSQQRPQKKAPTRPICLETVKPALDQAGSGWFRDISTGGDGVLETLSKENPARYTAIWFGGVRPVTPKVFMQRGFGGVAQP